jgi:WD40 repeat protein
MGDVDWHVPIDTDRSFKLVRLKKKNLIFVPCLSCFVLTHRNHRVWSVAWSPDGTKVASGSEDNTVKIWKTSTGTCVSTLSGHSDR